MENAHVFIQGKKEKQQLRSDMIEPILACNAIFHMTGEKGTYLTVQNIKIP